MRGNSERFIGAFNKIEKKLKEMSDLKPGQHKHFSILVKELTSTDSIIKRYEKDLLQYADLRNAIIHENIDGKYVIAEPHIETVEKIEVIETNLLAPKKLIPYFQNDVKVYNMDDELKDVLKEIKLNNYSQFPIYDFGKFKGLLTMNGIANSLAHNYKEEEGGVLITEDTTIRNMLKHEEIKENFLFVDRNKNIFDAIDLFQSNEHPIEALLITHNGKVDEKLLGILTVWDIMEMNKEII